MIEQLFLDLSSLPQVEAIALGGSRAGESYDKSSDYDIYLYCTAPINETIRHSLLEKYCSYMEIGNHFWELEDNCTLNNGIDIDILYRNLDDFTIGLSEVVEQYQAHNGYTTCMWHNLLTCKILYDSKGRLTCAKQRFTVPYPDQLKKNIIERNRKLLHNSLPAYDLQIKKALHRGDLVSINHRTAAFLESYFDILFALNAQTHPGEKRLIPYAKALHFLPEQFEENLNLLFSHLYTQPELVTEDLDLILGNLEKIL